VTELNKLCVKLVGGTDIFFCVSLTSDVFYNGIRFTVLCINDVCSL